MARTARSSEAHASLATVKAPHAWNAAATSTTLSGLHFIVGRAVLGQPLGGD
eukprot:CAMPEP_0168470444 /NCGR_PEP_ID=MMETSP0228-20121227/58732_1 /TAXON_ID=133427 /ORGANISM="Protoceratium reticulatum, Strain CCCM 535 (=CCMP 1889)" /LENGTH=51 /DNA_ID=CAMNT_0008486247 /DNA_START=28 /DNA_END=183 /DNA_ORIENTATION=+